MSQPLIMSFCDEAVEMCLDGRKTMTRRINKGKLSLSWRASSLSDMAAALCYVLGGDMQGAEPPVLTSISRNGRELWTVGKSIAIKPGRTSKAAGRVICTELKVERVQDISEEDARREGVIRVEKRTCNPRGVCVQWTFGTLKYAYPTAREAYLALWDIIHKKTNRVDANPLVVAIGFRPLEEGER